MARVKEVKILSIQQAMDNLATIVGIDLDNPPKLGIIHGHTLVTDEAATGRVEVFWLSAEGTDAILDILDTTFTSIHQHLVALLESNEVNWDDPKVRKGIQSMMVLADEAAHKMDKYLAFRIGKPLSTKVEERISYQDLQYFYQHRFSKQFEGEDQSWAEEISENANGLILESAPTGLMDFETVKRDHDYELFMIRNENGDSYFNDELLRNIRLVCFEAGTSGVLEDDPLLKIRAVEDRDLMATSQQILISCRAIIEDFYKIYRQVSQTELARNLSNAIMALYLTANPRNLIQNSAAKTSFQYFHDFQKYLRLAMNADEYQKFIAYPPSSKDKNAHLLMQLAHALCFSLFFRSSGVRQEVIGLLHRMMRKGEEKDRKTAVKGDTIWNQLLIDDEKFRVLLSQFPSGPLFKILDQIREEDPDLICFDPIMQNNLPLRLFEIQQKDHPIEILRMPCPVRQALINKVSIVEEFLGFLRFYGTQKPHKKHLLINLQDRSAWQEYARSLNIELLQKNAEFGQQLVVATLPKSSDFYYQNGEFMNMNVADQFVAEFKKQISQPEEHGFFFPPELNEKEFMNDAISWIHEEFFDRKSNLSRRNREDFVEIFYQMLILKWIEVLEPDSISFVCKDSVDTGAAQTAMFYGWIQMLYGNISEHADFLKYLFYSSAFLVRERAIDPERLNRAISAMERIDSSLEDRSSIFKRLSDLYAPKFLKSLNIKHL